MKLVTDKLGGPPAVLEERILELVPSGCWGPLWYFAEIVASPGCSIFLCRIKTTTRV